MMKRILLTTLVLGLVLAPSLSCKPLPVTETPTSTTPGYGSTGPLSNAELASLVIRHFPDGTVPITDENIRVTAYAVARAESGGNPVASGDNGQSIGIWQINTRAHPEYSMQSLFDPDYNAEAARAISNNGLNWNAWCTWQKTACNGKGNEAYKAYLNEARIALGIPPLLFPQIDGVVSPGEWDKAVAISLAHSWIMVRNDVVNLYVLIDVVSDTYEDTSRSGSAWPDYFLLSFDVNIDGEITPNVDVNYIGDRANVRLDRQYYLGPNWTGILQGDTAGRLAAGFGPSVNLKTPHLIWELVIPLSEIGAKPGGKVMIGLRTYSETPDFTDDYPTGFWTSFSNLMEIMLTRGS